MSPWSVCSCTLVNPFLDVIRGDGRLVTKMRIEIIGQG